jgi:hypothetical protein
MESQSPLGVPRPPRARWLLVGGVAAMIMAGAGLVYAVHAEWHPVPVVKPYDPFPSW